MGIEPLTKGRKDHEEAFAEGRRDLSIVQLANRDPVSFGEVQANLCWSRSWACDG